MKQIAKWANHLIFIALIVLLVTIVYASISVKLTGGRPVIAGYELLTVLSGSMEPKIKTGSVITVRAVEDASTLKAGDVITFRMGKNNDMLITHRIVEVLGTGAQIQFITKGDNNDSVDLAPIPAASVVAKYQGITIPYLGYILTFSTTPWGIVWMMIVPGMVLIVSQLVLIWRMLTTKKDDSNAPDVSPTAIPQENFSS